MFLIEIFKSFLNFFGLYKKQVNLLFLGLNNAGVYELFQKTTLLRKIKDNRIQALPPTQYAHNEVLTVNNFTFNAIDLGGHKAMRKIWKNYGSNAHGIAYLVDCSDQQRLTDSHEEFEKVLKIEEMTGIPIVILGNKIDKRDSCDEETLREQFGLLKRDMTGYSSLQHLEGHTVQVFMCSVVNGQGYEEGFQWLGKQLS